jgi:predicted phosphodiesterase
MKKTPLILINLFFLLLFSWSFGQKKENLRFAICTDVHQDIIHDAPGRIKVFVKAAQKEKVDFIIQLGDFCFPIEENKSFLKIWNSFSGQKYHVIGNHDMDVSSKQKEMDFLGMKKSYYSFDKGEFHCIVLDPNFFIEDGQYINYKDANYFGHDATRATIPSIQIEWLKKDIAQTNKIIIVFSHHRLEGYSGVKNQKEIREIFDKANLSGQKIIACFNGHDHDNKYAKVKGIHYIGINSMSYDWVGSKYENAERFSKEINEYRPNLKYTMPYTKPLFGIIEIDPKGLLTVKGKQGAYILPGPEELGVELNLQQSPSIPDRRYNSINN